MMRARSSLLVRFAPLLVAPLVLLAACGGDDAGSSTDDGSGTTDAAAGEVSATVAPVATDAPAGGDGADGGEVTMPAGGDAPMGLMVLDAMTLGFDAPAPVAGSITRSGLAAADPMSVDVRCMDLGGYLELSYSAVTPGEMPVEFFTLTADGVAGPGTYTATITLTAPNAPAGSMPFTEVTGKEAQLTVTGDLAGSFSVDDGFGNAITGSYSCTQAPMPVP